MAAHEVYAASALSAVAAILLARWCLTRRSGRPRTAAVSRRASRWTAPRDARRADSTAARAEQHMPTDASCAQRAVQEAEDLVHGYWRRLSPLYLSKREHHQH
ncbi:hypothetical protein [Streptomyces sp. A012304]|uniref:hypothetical protein n=1 Tax=Streptomyces sp. A012304 TaxID=375446 RepID=UPI00222FA559|nr:hypothetical protein [Streptomyces sp. A012304]GKQ40717.1 hypothetical protein ALMP_72400 [Streptomyces sp. A012304]